MLRNDLIVKSTKYLFTLILFNPNVKMKSVNDIYIKKQQMITQLKHMISDGELNLIEKEILRSMQKGLSSNDIAILFNCSKEMINKHRNSILQKTKCVTMFDVISLATKRGWV